jgi:YD repeat-containing protein
LVVGGAGAGKAAEGIIAKAVKDLFRVAEKDAGRAAARDAERAAARDAARSGGRDAARRAEREAAARAEARRVCGDPVDAATGEVVLSTVDVELPGVLPLILRRTHISSYRAGRFFGANWASTLDQRLEVSAGGVRYLGADGMVLTFPPPQATTVLPTAGSARWELREAGDGRYTLTDPDSGEIRWFARPQSSYAPTLPLVAVTDRSGRHRYDIDHDAAGMPTAVRHSGGYRVGVQTTGGLATGYRLDSGDGVQLVRFGYGGDGRLVAVVDSSGQPMRLGYDADGRLAWWVDRNGTGYRYEYDERGRCVAAGGPSGHLTARFDYGDGQRTAYTNSLGGTTIFELNELGQIVREVDPLGHATTQQWDEYDRLVARTDAAGNTTRWQYDGNGDLGAVITPGGGRRTADYNARHQAVTVVGPDGARWAAEYDASGNLIATTDPGGARTGFEFADGRLAGVTDALGRRQRIETDAAGLVVSLTEPDGARTGYQRDAFGRVVAVTDALGNTTRYGWTVEGRLAWRTLPDGATDRWRYDGEGNQT